MQRGRVVECPVPIVEIPQYAVAQTARRTKPLGVERSLVEREKPDRHTTIVVQEAEPRGLAGCIRVGKPTVVHHGTE